MRRVAVPRGSSVGFTRFAVLLAMLAAPAAIARAAAPAAFALALDGPVSAAHAPYLHAIVSGAYRGAGLDVTIVHPDDRGAALIELAAGRADACVADAVAIIAARADGAKITIVASIGDLHPACVVSLPGTGITSAAQLTGKRIAVDPLGGDRLLFTIFLAGAGLRPEDVTLVPLDDAGRQAVLAAGAVDAVLDRLESVAQGLSVLRWADSGFALYGPCIAVRDEVLRDRAPVVRAFLKATLKTWEASLREPTAAAQSAAASGLVTKEAAEAWLAAVVFRFDTDTYRKKGLGWIDRSRMTATLEAVRGMLGQPVTFAVAEVFTDAYLPVPAVLRKAAAAAAPAASPTPLQR